MVNRAAVYVEYNRRAVSQIRQATDIHAVGAVLKCVAERRIRRS